MAYPVQSLVPQTPVRSESPFMIFPNERHEKQFPVRRTSREEADWLLGRGRMGKLELAILCAVHLLNYATEKQIRDFLAQTGSAEPDKTQLHEILDNLHAYSFLDRLVFYSDAAPGPHMPCYCLGYHGIGTLRSTGLHVDNPPYLSAVPTWKIKRQLAANQAGLCWAADKPLRICPAMVLSCQPSNSIAVKPQLILKGENEVTLIEAVRSTPDWQGTLEEKLIRYATLLKHARQVPDFYSFRPRVILVFESICAMDSFARVRRDPLPVQSAFLFSNDRAIYENPGRAFVAADLLLPRRSVWNTLLL